MYQGLGYDFFGQPTLVAEALGLYDSVCTIMLATNTVDAVGQVDLTSSGFANLAGVVSIPCMRAPESASRIIGSEAKGPTLTEAINPFHVLLDGYYPQIPEAANMRPQLKAVIDGVDHEVMAVESSSQMGKALQTRLTVRQVGV